MDPKNIGSMSLAEVIHEIDAIRSIADGVYDVRDRAVTEDESWDGNSWDHPTVKRYGALCTKMRELLQAAGVMADV